MGVGSWPAGGLLEGLQALAVLVGVELAAGQPLGQDLLGTGPWLLVGLRLLVGLAGAPQQGEGEVYPRRRPDMDSAQQRLEGPQVEVDSELLRGIGSCRFQLVVSTGFQTTIVESTESIAGPPLARELTIIQPKAEAGVVQGDPVWLIGATAKRLDGRKDSVNAYWSSNRDGFLGDGLRVLVSTLSAGRHVLRLAVDDETDGEVTQSVSIWVKEQSAEPPAEEGGED